jgi:hypothetical protein
MKSLLLDLLRRLLSITSLAGLGLGYLTYRGVVAHGWGEGSVSLALVAAALLLVHDRELLSFLAQLWQQFRRPPPAPCLLLLGLALGACRSLPQRCAELYPTQIVERRDTVIRVGGFKTDTLTVRTTEYDTVRIDTGRISVQVIRHRDTLRIAAECRADTVRLPGVIQTRVRTITLTAPWWNTFFVGMAVAVALAALGAWVVRERERGR